MITHVKNTSIKKALLNASKIQCYPDVNMWLKEQTSTKTNINKEQNSEKFLTKVIRLYYNHRL